MRHHSRLAAAALGLALGLVSGCDVLDPFPTVPIPAPPGAPAGQRVGICYNTLTTSLAEVQAQAQQQCPADTVAEPVDTDYHVQTCPLLIPGRASFLCTRKK